MNLCALIIRAGCGLAAIHLAGAALARAQPAQRTAQPSAGPSAALASFSLFAVPKFRFDAGAPLLAPAGVAPDGTWCVGTVDGYVHALDADGSYRWSYSVQGAVTRRPLYSGQLWFVATNADRVYAFTRGGALSWVFKPPSAVSSELVSDAQGKLFFIGADRFLYGVSAHGAVTSRTPLKTQSARRQEAVPSPSAAPAESAFTTDARLTDPQGYEWYGRSDGVLELRIRAGAAPSLTELTRSPLLPSVWSPGARCVLLSARNGLVFALDALRIPQSR